jgi:hypothetical protein
MDGQTPDTGNAKATGPAIWRVRDYSGNPPPKVFADLAAEAPYLEVLRLRDCGLRELPDNPGHFPRLRVLDMRGNELVKIPDEFFFGMEALEHLDLARNQLTELPRTIACLSQLRQLDLRANQLTHLPPALGRLAALRILDLTANPKGGLLVPATAIYGQGEPTLSRGLTHLHTRGTGVRTDGTIPERLATGCPMNLGELDLDYEWTATFPECEDQSMAHRAIFMAADDPVARVRVLSIRRSRRGLDIRLAAIRRDGVDGAKFDAHATERRAQLNLDLAARAVTKAMGAANPADALTYEYGSLQEKSVILGADGKYQDYSALIIMTDLKGSTSYPQDIQRKYMNEYWAMLRKAMKAMDSQPSYIRPTGDGVCMAYTNLYNGLRMALYLAQNAKGETGNALFRIGINWGNIQPFPEFSTNKDDLGIQGTAIAIAGRLEQAGTPGKVLAYHTLKQEIDKMPEKYRTCFQVDDANTPEEIKKSKESTEYDWDAGPPGPSWEKPWSEELPSGEKVKHKKGELIRGFWISLKPSAADIIDFG